MDQLASRIGGTSAAKLTEHGDAKVLWVTVYKGTMVSTPRLTITQSTYVVLRAEQELDRVTSNGARDVVRLEGKLWSADQT